MGKIPQFTQTVLPQRAQPGLALVEQNRGAAEAAQFEQNASNIVEGRRASGKISNALMEYKLREADAANTTYVNEKVVEYKRSIIDQLDTARQSRAGNPQDFHKDFDRQLRKQSEAFLKDAPSEVARSSLRQSMDQVRLGYYDDNQRWERGRRVEMFGESMDRTAENLNTLAYRAGQEGRDIGESLRDVQASVVAGSTFVAGDKLDKIRGTMSKGVVANYIEGMAETQPHQARELLKSKKYDDILGADELQRLDKVAEAGVEKQQAKLRADLEPIIKDAIAEAENTGKTEIMPKKETVIAAYGDVKGEKIWQEYEKATEFGEAFSQIATMPAGDIRNLLESKKPQGEGFADEQSRYKTLVAAVSAREKQVKEDPMGYVQRNVPAVEAAFDRLAGDAAPPELQAAITEGLDAQAALGIPQYQRRVLPKGAASGIIGQMSTGTPQERLQQASVLKQQYGEHWPAVYADLVKEGLPDETAVMLRMDAPMQSVPAAKLAEAEATGMKNLEKAVGDKDDIKTMQTTVSSELADYFGTVIVQPGNGAEVGRMTNAATALAYQYSLEGKSAGDAAKQAVQDIVGRKYNVAGTVRIPYQYNADLVQDGLKFIMKPDFLQSWIGKYVEPNIVGSMLGTPEDIQKEEYVRMVAEHGYFVTAPDEKGVMVFDQTGHTVMARDKQGEIVPLTLMFNDLEALGTKLGEPKKIITPSGEVISESRYYGIGP